MTSKFVTCDTESYKTFVNQSRIVSKRRSGDLGVLILLNSSPGLTEALRGVFDRKRNFVDHIDKAIEVLNELHTADPSVMNTLVSYRVPCNDDVADHDTIQVGVTPDGYVVGILGIINGIFGINEYDSGYIVANTENGAIINFERKKID